LLIDNIEVKVNVLILSMEHEIEVLLGTLESLMLDLEDGVIVSVLLNGGSSKDLRENLGRYPSIRYYESSRNLGVAGGRKFLCSTEEFKASDVILFLDNDVIVPRGYVRKITGHLVSDPGMGAAGAVVLDIKQYYSKLEKFKRDTGGLIPSTYDVSIDDLKTMFLAAPTSKGLFHIGTHPNWVLAYLMPVAFIQTAFRKFAQYFGKKSNFNTNLKEDIRYLKLIESSPRIEVSNIAGCCQSFRRSLLEEIGTFDDAFSPYGMEDVDFNVRAKKAGYRNFTMCDTWLLHGTDTRHKERNQEKSFENTYRVLTLFAYKHAPRLIFKQLVLLRIWSNWFLLKKKKNPNAQAYYEAQMRGLRLGLQELDNRKSAGVIQTTA